MFRLSKKTEYCLMALQHILSKKNEPSSAREIAEAYDIPFEVLAKLLQTLAREGILVSRHGTRGGYSPARDPASITLREVMEAIEGPVALVGCAAPRRKSCGQEKKCRVKRPLARLSGRVVDMLGRVTLREI